MLFRSGPASEDAETGPLISANHLNKVQEYVDKGIAEGAKLLVGGKLEYFLVK